MTAPHADLPTYVAIVLTFGRPDSLRTVVGSVVGQDWPPIRVVVVDNNPDRSAEGVVGDLVGGAIPVDYVATGANLGPAGGWAHGVMATQASPSRGDWVVLFDDDDPLDGASTMRSLMLQARDAPEAMAAIGLRGARLRQLALLSRVEKEGQRVDYLASSGAPSYRWAAVDEVGFFDPELFFGFEDLDLGLRLQRAGWTLSVAFDAQERSVRDTATIRNPWREYYKTRALVTICRRHVGVFATVVTVLRAAVLAVPGLMVREGGGALVKARWRGVRDGLAGRLGPGPYVPAANPAKPL